MNSAILNEWLRAKHREDERGASLNLQIPGPFTPPSRLYSIHFYRSSWGGCREAGFWRPKEFPLGVTGLQERRGHSCGKGRKFFLKWNKSIRTLVAGVGRREHGESLRGKNKTLCLSGTDWKHLESRRPLENFGGWVEWT